MIVREAPIGEIAEAIIDYRGRTPPKAPTGIPLVTAKVIKDGAIDESRLEFIAEETYAWWMRRGMPRQRDILITTEAPLGETAMLRSDHRVALAQRVILLRGDPAAIDQDYFFTALRSPLMQARLRQRATGTTVVGIKQSELRQVLIPLPPLDIQRRIGSVVSAYDDLIENNNRRMAILEEMAQRIYREWFTDFRYPGHGAVALVQSDQGAIPDGWRWSILGDLATETRFGVEPTTVDPDTPYVGLEHMPERSIALSAWGAARDVTSRKYAYQSGQILFGKIRPYFHKVVVPAVEGLCSTDAIVIENRTDLVWGLVLAVVSSDSFVAEAVQTAQGTKMPRANWEVLKNFRVAVPDDALLSKFNSYMKQTVDLIHRCVLANRNLRATRDLLLPRLVAGEVDVTDIDVAVSDAAA